MVTPSREDNLLLQLQQQQSSRGVSNDDGPRKPVVHEDIWCDNCGQTPIRGHRYKCVNCRDFDLCHSCEELQVHDAAHTFLKIRTPRPNQEFPFVHVAGDEQQQQTQTQTQQQQQKNVDSTFSSVFNSLLTNLNGQKQMRGRDATPPSPDMVDSVNRLGFQILRRVMGSEHSPASPRSEPTGLSAPNIYLCLMMAASGARGLTRDAFARTLGFKPEAVDEFIRGMVHLDGYCTRSSSSAKLELTSAASAWHLPHVQIDAGWRTVVEDVFGGVVGRYNGKLMNMWVEANTKGRIRDIFMEDSIGADPVTLVTALYFKRDWAEPFQKENTRRAEFHGFDNGTQLCDMMHRTGDISYWEDDVAQMCVLPYVRETNATAATIGPQGRNVNVAPGWKAAVILPKASGPAAFANIVSHFSDSPDTLRLLMGKKERGEFGALGGAQPTLLHVSLPRFTLKLQFGISDALSEMGLSSAFKPSADFGGMGAAAAAAATPSTGPNASTAVDPLYLGDITHHLFVEVNEQGTEMAAVTTTMFGGSPRKLVPKEMNVDRPFLFMIFDENSMVVLCSVVVSEIG